MTSGPIMWRITDEDAQTAEDAKHAERMAELAAWALRFADVLATIHGELSRRMTHGMADSVTLEYARIMLQGGHAYYEDGCDEDTE
jgi:hypothetical protein